MTSLRGVSITLRQVLERPIGKLSTFKLCAYQILQTEDA